MVRVEEDYRFNDGEVSLRDLFDGRRQLVVQHVMFDPDWDDACSSCSAALEASDAYGFLDLTALGRQEEWEEPKGRSDAGRKPVPNFR